MHSARIACALAAALPVVDVVHGFVHLVQGFIHLCPVADQQIGQHLRSFKQVVARWACGQAFAPVANIGHDAFGNFNGTAIGRVNRPELPRQLPALRNSVSRTLRMACRTSQCS